MSPSATLSGVVSSLFTEPLEGFNKAQIQILDHWIKTLNLLPSTTDPLIYAQTLKMAPKWSAALRGDISVVMRMTRLTQHKGGLSLGVGVGPFQASGSYGFMSESTSESVIQARAAYVVANDSGEVALVDMLKTLGIANPLSPDQVGEAVERLKSLKEALPKSPEEEIEATE